MQAVKTNLGIIECLDKLREIANAPVSYTDEIPEVLKADFREFIIGRTLSILEGREVTHDLKAYIDQIMYKGIGYHIVWNAKTA